jgi:serine/threonine protein kinase
MLGETRPATVTEDEGLTRLCRAHGRLPSGAEFKGYRIERLLGRGGMGVVYEATQTSLNRRVALKLLPAESAQNVVLQARFRREALMQAALDHPHIVDVYETGVCEAGLFIAMRLVRGETLRDKIGDEGMDPRLVLALLTPVGDALDTAHACGLVHRDVKPQNILIGPRTHAYLADFGLVRPFADGPLTQAGGLLGTPAYLAPEVMEGRAATAASDVFSFAVVLHECLTGHPSTCRGTLDGAIADVVGRGLAAEPKDRPATASGLMELAGRALRPPRRPLPPRRPAQPAPDTERWLTRRRLAAACLALLAFAALGELVAWTTGAANPVAPLAVRFGPLHAMPTSAAAFTLEHGRLPDDLPLRDGPGVALETNASVDGGGEEPLPIVCIVRDLTAQRFVGDREALPTPPPALARSFTVTCWVPVDLQPGHRYEVLVKIFHPRYASAPVRTAWATFFVQ